MSTRLLRSWPDSESAVLTILRAGLPGVAVHTIKQEQDLPYECVTIRCDPQQQVTPLSRYVRVGISAWSVTEAGQADIPAARQLCARACQAIEHADFDGDPLVWAETDSGPMRVEDDITKLEYAYAVVLAEIHAI